MCFQEIHGTCQVLFLGHMLRHAALALSSSCSLTYWPLEQVLKNKEQKK